MFILFKIFVETIYRNFVNEKLNEIFGNFSSNNTKEIKFKSIYDFDNYFTIASFKLIKPKKVLFEIKRWNVDGFKIYLDGKLIISRKCLDGFYFTRNGCSKTNACLDKKDGDIVADSRNKNILYKCDGHTGVRDIISSYDEKPMDIEVVKSITNVENEKLSGNCDSHKAVAVNIPDMWTSSEMYKQCVDAFWNFKFCPKVKNTNNYSKVLEEIRDVLDDGILYRPLNQDVSVFDENTQKCIPFDYARHYKNGKIPLLYNDIVMFDHSNILPTVVYNSLTKTKESTPSLHENRNYNDRDKEECFLQYQEYTNGVGEFLGLLTVAYSDVILSCRCGKPVNKLVVDQNKNPSFWGRASFGENSYTDKKHNIHICKGHLHRFIPTCVEDIECVNADGLIPLKSPSVGIANDFDINFCSKTGRLQYTLQHNIRIDKFCKNSKEYRVHPYYNIPIDCKKKKIRRDLSFRNLSLNTFKIKNDSIFKNDINALNLHFFEGIDT